MNKGESLEENAKMTGLVPLAEAASRKGLLLELEAMKGGEG